MKLSHYQKRVILQVVFLFIILILPMYALANRGEEIPLTKIRLPLIERELAVMLGILVTTVSAALCFSIYTTVIKHSHLVRMPVRLKPAAQHAKRKTIKKK